MFLLDGIVVTSASDLTTASKCEFAFLRALDARLGKIDAVEEPEDAMLARAARLGDAHEEAVLERYRLQYATVAEIERASIREPGSLDAAIAATAEAFASEADVVYQPAFFDGQFLGYADFIVRTPDGSYEVQDSKLARSAKVTALLQLAAYAEQLVRIGVRPAETVRLLLGDGSVSVHLLRDILPVYRNRRAHLEQLVAARVADPNPVRWGAAGHTACGHCASCEPEIEASRDLLLVAGLRLTQRAVLIDAGITTIDDLAISTGPVAGMSDAAAAALRAQARLQLLAVPGAPPPLDFHSPAAIATLPVPDPGDIFFDFEGDPLYSEGSAGGDETRWGLDYLFGLVDVQGAFTAFWAHDFAEERVALEEFLTYLRERRARHPGMHVYHYASYERSHLLSLAARHGVGEEEIDDLLRDNVLVDLYPVVRKALRIGGRSYSLKKIEPLYLRDARAGEVTNALDSVEEYVRYRELRATGDPDEADSVLAQIADYNRVDCVSTLELRDWMLAQAAARGVHPGTLPRVEREPLPLDESPLSEQLRAFAGDPIDPDRTADQRAFGLAAAAVDYHRREAKSFWWAHFARLLSPLDEWADARDVFIVDDVTIERDWHLPPGKRARRFLRLRGQLAPGSRLTVGDNPFLVYDYDGPTLGDRAEPGARPSHARTNIVELAEDGSILVEEWLAKDAVDYDDLPIALTPPPPIRPGAQVPAIQEWGLQLLAARPDWPKDAVVDVLRRTPPRTASGALATGGEIVDALVASLLDLDSSYLAVQGPPGTGKTYTGAHVIARLVTDHGWRIGVVSQSHTTVENLLAAVLDAGLRPGLVGKKPKSGAENEPTPWMNIADPAAFLAKGGGRVVGGTAWTFSNREQVPRRSLDLLVIDEAGQFSLASTIAASMSAQRLLLLGDPQQLPQVSQGTHPEPVDGSALGFVSDGHEVLPAELGYFLPESRRMDAALAAPVSALSYEGRLRSHPVTRQRLLEGVAPGLHPLPVAHEGDATSSPVEAAAVVDLVESLLGTPWTDPGAGRAADPLGDDDFIVVTPYNAQVVLVREALDAAGHPGVRVGTVDRFQGQEAVVAIVTLAASSAVEVPRGLPFLILKNRLNVAISRAQWAAYLIHSPELVDFLPPTPAGVAQLSAFIELTS